VLEDDPLLARHTASVVSELRRHEPVIATNLVAQAAAIDGSVAVIVGAGFGGRPLASTVAAARAGDDHRPVLVVCPSGDADVAEAAASVVGAMAVVSRPVVASELLPRLVAALERAELARTVVELTRQLDLRDHALASSQGAAERASAALASTSTELATATERLVTAEQLAAVGRVVSGIAHELGQQLALVGYAEAIKARVSHDPELVELADVIVGAQRRLLAMVDSIRDFAEQGGAPLAREPVDVVTIVDDALALLRHDPDVRRRRIERRVAGHPLCLAHRGKLAQVIINLVHNAALASPPGAVIDVELEVTADDGAAVTVRDRGAGMPAAVVARLGEPFFTTRGDRGSGLGVGICKRIVEDHGGTLTFTSGEGVGTTAVVRLPGIGAGA
jgi:signal transduction histidine kinase